MGLQYWKCTRFPVPVNRCGALGRVTIAAARAGILLGANRVGAALAFPGTSSAISRPPASRPECRSRLACRRRQSAVSGSTASTCMNYAVQPSLVVCLSGGRIGYRLILLVAKPSTHIPVEEAGRDSPSRLRGVIVPVAPLRQTPHQVFGRLARQKEIVELPADLPGAISCLAKLRDEFSDRLDVVVGCAFML